MLSSHRCAVEPLKPPGAPPLTASPKPPRKPIAFEGGEEWDGLRQRAATSGALSVSNLLDNLVYYEYEHPHYCPDLAAHR